MQLIVTGVESELDVSFDSIRVSNELGGGNPKGASVAVRVVLSIALVEGMILVSAMILLRNVWGHVYSNDKEVIKYVSLVMPTLAISSFLDGIQSALSGIFFSYQSPNPFHCKKINYSGSLFSESYSS